jgi:GMP synthase-like glutamine amidotransferase
MTRPVLVIEHAPDAGLDLMAGPFGVSLRVLRPYQGDALPELSDRGRGDDTAEYAGLIVLGGEMGAMDDDVAPWLPATRRLMADAVRQELPTLGICLGSQLLAAACGGVVERGAAGLEIGVVPITPLPAVDGDPFFGQLGPAISLAPAPRWAVYQYHYDAVTRLPAEAELMVTGDRYPHQGFRVGRAAWGVQYHPEVSTTGFVQWVETGQRTGELSDQDAATVLTAIRAAEGVQERLASAHARAFLQVVGRTCPAGT